MLKLKNIKYYLFQIIAIILYIDILSTPKSVIEEGQPQFAAFQLIPFLIKCAIMMALSVVVTHLMTKKPGKLQHSKPAGLEQFDIPSAEEGRPVQVLFGKKYIAGSNVVWYGDLKTTAIRSKDKEGALQ